MKHIRNMEKKYSNAAILVMGDFNTIKLKLPTYPQLVIKPTREQKILYKCYVSIRNAYPQCTQLGKLEKSDHRVMQLFPNYQNKARYIPKKLSPEDCTQKKPRIT